MPVIVPVFADSFKPSGSFADQVNGPTPPRTETLAR
jgi:hypothetical protein